MNNSSKVAIVRCNSYEPETVSQAVKQAVDLLGGISAFVSPAQNVLIKPNMLSPQPPDRAITTHPSIVEAVVELVKSAGARPAIGDSPGLYPGFNKFTHNAKVSGISQVAERTGAPLTPFDKEVQISTSEKCLMKRITVAQAVTAADAIISVPKFKTHSLTYITGAIKNLFGCVPGLKKSEMHFRFPDNERFSRMLVDVALSIPVCLHIVDAVTGMDGNGPSGGDPFPIGLIIAGADPVAVDSIACRVVGIDPEEIPMIRIGAECGLGATAENAICIVGDSLENVRVSGFRPIPPHTGTVKSLPLPRFLLKNVKRWFIPKPRILRHVCTRCGACIEICPARPKALEMKKGKVVVNDDACILCYCCQEICPSRAVELRRGFAAKLLAKLLKIE